MYRGSNFGCLNLVCLAKNGPVQVAIIGLASFGSCQWWTGLIKRLDSCGGRHKNVKGAGNSRESN